MRVRASAVTVYTQKVTQNSHTSKEGGGSQLGRKNRLTQKNSLYFRINNL